VVKKEGGGESLQEIGRRTTLKLGRTMKVWTTDSAICRRRGKITRERKELTKGTEGKVFLGVVSFSPRKS